MKIEEKRKVIEVLLCGSDVRAPGVAFMAIDWLGSPYSHGALASDLRCEAQRSDFSLDYEQSCVLAAYRLIESSPTLRREWFGR